MRSQMSKYSARFRCLGTAQAFRMARLEVNAVGQHLLLLEKRKVGISRKDPNVVHVHDACVVLIYYCQLFP